MGCQASKPAAAAQTRSPPRPQPAAQPSPAQSTQKVSPLQTQPTAPIEPSQSPSLDLKQENAGASNPGETAAQNEPDTASHAQPENMREEMMHDQPMQEEMGEQMMHEEVRDQMMHEEMNDTNEAQMATAAQEPVMQGSMDELAQAAPADPETMERPMEQATDMQAYPDFNTAAPGPAAENEPADNVDSVQSTVDQQGDLEQQCAECVPNKSMAPHQEEVPSDKLPTTLETATPITDMEAPEVDQRLSWTEATDQHLTAPGLAARHLHSHQELASISDDTEEKMAAVEEPQAERHICIEDATSNLSAYCASFSCFSGLVGKNNEEMIVGTKAQPIEASS